MRDENGHVFVEPNSAAAVFVVDQHLCEFLRALCSQCVVTVAVEGRLPGSTSFEEVG